MQARDVDFGQLGALAAIVGGAATGAYGMYKGWRADRLQNQESNIKYALELIKTQRDEMTHLRSDLDHYRAEAETCQKRVADLERLIGRGR